MRIFSLLSSSPYTPVISVLISSGNRTEWSPIRSVIILVINKIVAEVRFV